MVSVQAAAGSIIYKAMRVFYQSRKVELEEYRATSMLWEYTEMHGVGACGPFSAARGGGGGEGALATSSKSRWSGRQFLRLLSTSSEGRWSGTSCFA